MNRTQELREQIDACRPGSDDLSLPELVKLREAVERDAEVARELERSQRFDRTVMAAMQDVEIPVGLADRLLKAASAAGAAGEVSPAATAEPSRRKPSRRNWLIAIGSIAALLLCGVTLALINSRPPRRVSQEELAQSIPEWVRQVSDQDGWVTNSAIRPHQAFALPAKTLQRQPVAWRRFTTPAGETGVVYRCNPAGKQPAYLFVVNTRAQYTVGNMPFTNVTGTTGRVAVGAWQTGRMLYVMVVEKDGQRLEDYLRQPRVT